MAKYFCTHCKFKFSSENPFECPYCGRKNSIEKEKSAEELLGDIDDLLQE